MNEEVIIANCKKLKCCTEEVIESAVNGIRIRIGIHTDRAKAEITKPLTPDEMAKAVEHFENAHKSLLEIQHILDK